MKPLKLCSLLFLLSVSVLVSCSKEEKPQVLDVNKTELQFPAGVSTREFTITTTGDWLIEANGLEPLFGGNMGRADWYTVEPLGGTGDTKVTVTSKEETAGNTATLKIKYDGKEKTVVLKQDIATENE